MAGMSDYEKYDGLGLAELVRKGETTPSELCEEAIKRIEQINPKLNAVVTRMDDEGRRTAKGPWPAAGTAAAPSVSHRPIAACSA